MSAATKLKAAKIRWAREDALKAYTVYRHGRPAYQAKRAKPETIVDALLFLSLATLTVILLLVI